MSWRFGALAAGLGLLAALTAGWGVSRANPARPAAPRRVTPVAAALKSARWVVIEGRVAAVHSTWALVEAPPLVPCCPPGAMCPAFVLTGLPFRVGFKHAVFENADGMEVRGRLSANTDVVIAGVETATATLPVRLRAYVLEKGDLLAPEGEVCRLKPVRP